MHVIPNKNWHDFLFGTENEGFFILMIPFLVCITIVTEFKNCEIRMKNAKFAGKIKSQDEFFLY